MEEEKKKILELQGVSVGYNNHIVLEDVNLVIYEKDFIGVIGANGSGKTTLLKVILGLLRPLRGKVQFFIKDPGQVKKYIGYMPQASTFDRKFPITVKNVVISGLTARVGPFKGFSRKDKARSNEVMEQMGILPLENKAIGELSGGEMQRVFLARALISAPKLLVLDEPNTFVDKTFEKSFYEILKELNKAMAIILVSHDIGMISSYVKTIACVCRYLHYHETNEITQELLDTYNCPIDLITHGDLPHRVLKSHKGCETCAKELDAPGEK